MKKRLLLAMRLSMEIIISTIGRQFRFVCPLRHGLDKIGTEIRPRGCVSYHNILIIVLHPTRYLVFVIALPTGLRNNSVGYSTISDLAGGAVDVVNYNKHPFCRLELCISVITPMHTTVATRSAVLNCRWCTPSVRRALVYTATTGG